MSLLDKINLFMFRPYLKCWKCNKVLRVVKIKGWGMFLVECKDLARVTIAFDWWKGFI